MRDIQSIIAVCREEMASGQPLALATVVKVEGSAYRRPGARMLVSSDGTRIGSISGGCLEADVAAHAQKAMQSGKSAYVLYDSRISNGDVLAELGCKGAVGVLIEPVTPRILGCLEFLASFDRERGKGVLATVFAVKGDSAVCVGDRLMQRENGERTGTMQEPRLIEALLPCLANVMEEGRAQVQSLSLLQSRIEILIEPVHSPIILVLCGAGQDAIPLAQMALLLGWQVIVLDHRDSLLSSERFPGTVLLSERRKEDIPLDTRTAVVLMTHSYAHDLRWLQFVQPSPVCYIGLLGPRRRAEQLQNDLEEEGLLSDEAALTRFYGPTGLDLGAETSEEIALSVLAEIQAVFHEGSGEFLRNRVGPIHDTTVIYNQDTAHLRASCPALA